MENLLLLLGVPGAFVLAGYWLAARLGGLTAAERLATAVLAGVGLLLWNVGVVSCFRPLGGAWAWLCLWPIACTLAAPGVRRQLVGDLTATAFTRPGAIAAALLAAFLVLLLWPVLTRPELVYYDGSSSHDAFLWVVGAEHLKRHTYWEMPAVTPSHPFAHTAGAVVGWRPAWGRIGGEGLLALLSSVVGLAPVKIYLSATAALVVPWLAAVYLVARTFLVDRLGRWGLAALCGLPASFVFFHGNANLPNLFGAITGATVIVAIERSLRGPAHRGVWRVLLALSVHGLLCSYPEMVPFILLPGGLLWLRAAFAPAAAGKWRSLSLTLLAGLAGGVINPATTIRAWFGFFGMLTLARTSDQWGNLFRSLTWAHHPAALFTLAVRATRLLGAPLAAGVSIVIIGALITVCRRARDRFGAIAILTGGAVMGGYTLVSGFGYGWQKTAQFAAPFLAAVVPVVAADLYSVTVARRTLGSWLARSSAVVVVLFFAWATVWNCLEEHKWSRSKAVTRDWFALRDHVRVHPAGEGGIVVEPATFRTAFFHGMWATYFLADVPLYFAARGEQNGGYVRDAVATEGAETDRAHPAGFLVSRDWADAVEPGSERLFDGESVVLLRRSHRVLTLAGVTPENGVPRGTHGRVSLAIRPHSRARLVVVIEPQTPANAAARWRVHCAAGGRTTFESELPAAPRWHIAVPLEPGQRNEIELVAEPLAPSGALPAFALRTFAIEPVP